MNAVTIQNGILALAVVVVCGGSDAWAQFPKPPNFPRPVPSFVPLPQPNPVPPWVELQRRQIEEARRRAGDGSTGPQGWIPQNKERFYGSSNPQPSWMFLETKDDRTVKYTVESYPRPTLKQALENISRTTLSRALINVDRRTLEVACEVMDEATFRVGLHVVDEPTRRNMLRYRQPR